MDIHSNAVPSSLPEDYFPGENNMEGGGGASLEWVSAFVEECLNGGGFTTTQPPPPSVLPPPTTKPAAITSPRPTTKTRTKRRKLKNPAESPLVMVPQTHWLAESELLVVLPRKEGREEEVVVAAKEEEEETSSGRRCTHCMSQKTPQWRAGPMGPKTLCNACGVRFKSGRLLPEYRPAKSPTFQTYKHSNSHKKVMELRSISSTPTPTPTSSSNAK